MYGEWITAESSIDLATELGIVDDAYTPTALTFFARLRPLLVCSMAG